MALKDNADYFLNKKWILVQKKTTKEIEAAFIFIDKADDKKIPFADDEFPRTKSMYVPVISMRN